MTTKKATGGRKKKTTAPKVEASVAVEVATHDVATETQTEVVVAAPPVPAPVTKPIANSLTVTISSQLKAKICDQAADEGISVNEYVGELLAEGVVLRAWEIVERKAQMRGGNQVHPQSQGNNRNGNGNGNGNNRRNDRFNNRRGMNSARYNSIMDDKASFLEYVRNQERQQGR